MVEDLTLFYSPITGKVKHYCMGVQDMNYFGEDKFDYNYNTIIVQYDEFIVKNLDSIRIEDGELKMVYPSFLPK